MEFAPISLSAPDFSNPPTADSTPVQRYSSPPQEHNILKKESSWNRKISPATSEIASLGKKVSLAKTLQVFSLKDRTGDASIETVKWTPSQKPLMRVKEKEVGLNPEDKLSPNKFMLKRSNEITQWAYHIAAQRDQEFIEAEKAWSEFKNLSTDEKTIAKLKKDLSIIKAYSTEAKKYAKWVEKKERLLGGDQELKKKIKEQGFSMESDRSLQEIEEDWEDAKAQPWAQKNLVYDRFQGAIHTRQEMEAAKATLRSLAQEVQQLPQRKKEHPSKTIQAKALQSATTQTDMVFIPGVGDVDRNQYDIGNITYDENGKATIWDMTGRKYDRP